MRHLRMPQRQAVKSQASMDRHTAVDALAYSLASLCITKYGVAAFQFLALAIGSYLGSATN